MTQTCWSTWTWFAASPAPSYSRMVSIMSSMSRCVSGARMASSGTGRAGCRSTGCPRRATFRIAMPSILLLDLDLAHLPHALGQTPGVGLEEALELRPLLERDGRLQLVHRALEGWILDGLAERPAEPGERGLGCAPRGEDAGPDVELRVRVAELLEGRYVRQRGHARVAPAGERTELAGLDVGQHDGRARGEGVHVAAEDRRERRPSARVGHVAKLDPGRVREQLHRHVDRAVDARRAERDLAGPLPGVLDEVLRRLPGLVRGHDQDRRVGRDQRERP